MRGHGPIRLGFALKQRLGKDRGKRLRKKPVKSPAMDTHNRKQKTR